MRLPQYLKAVRERRRYPAQVVTVEVQTEGVLEAFARVMQEGGRALSASLSTWVDSMAERNYPGDPFPRERLGATLHLAKATRDTGVEMREAVQVGRVRAQRDVDDHLAAWRQQVLYPRGSIAIDGIHRPAHWTGDPLRPVGYGR